MYQSTKQILEKYGYHRYEISNYAKEGCECRHNLGYWERRDYLGIGLGAASLMNNVRWNESSSLEEFNRKYSGGKEIIPEMITEGGEKLSIPEQMEEFMFLGLRKMKGISKADFQKYFQIPIDQIYGEQLCKLCQEELLECEEGHIRLTERGIDISNYVMSEFILM